MRTGNLRNWLLGFCGYVLLVNCTNLSYEPTQCMTTSSEEACSRDDTDGNIFSYLGSIFTSIGRKFVQFVVYVWDGISNQVFSFYDSFSDKQEKGSTVLINNFESEDKILIKNDDVVTNLITSEELKVNETGVLDTVEIVNPEIVEVVNPETVEIVNPEIVETVNPEIVETVNPEIVETINPIISDASEQLSPDITMKEQVILDQNTEFSISSLFYEHGIEIGMILAILIVTCYLAYVFVTFSRTDFTKNVYNLYEDALSKGKSVSKQFSGFLSNINPKGYYSTPGLSTDSNNAFLKLGTVN